MNSESLNLPTEIEAILNKQLVKENNEYQYLIGKGGYKPAEQSIIHDAVVALALRKNVLLKGPTGSGKTRLAETLSGLFSQPMHSINCSVDLDAESLLGFKTLSNKDGNTSIEFVEGPVIKAMKRGHLLYIDEINMAKPETLPILNGVLDYRRMITNPFTGEVVKAVPEFTVIAAINEGYVGTVPLNEALKNRFIVLDVPYIQGDFLKQILLEQSSITDEKLVDLFVSFSADLITQVKNGQISEEAASIRALLDTCDLAEYMSPLRAIQRGIIEKLDDDREKAAIRNIAETLFE